MWYVYYKTKKFCKKNSSLCNQCLLYVYGAKVGNYSLNYGS